MNWLSSGVAEAEAADSSLRDSPPMATADQAVSADAFPATPRNLPFPSAPTTQPGTDAKKGSTMQSPGPSDLAVSFEL